MRNQFDKELEILHIELIDMGELIEKAIEEAVCGLLKKNETLAEQTIANEDSINKKEHDIENHCLRLLLQQQPVARDLRVISSALKMITDMERIGDQASDIAEITLRLMKQEEQLYLDMPMHIGEMSVATISMVQNAIDAFVKSDIKKAQEVVLYDDVVDNLFLNVRDDLINSIRESATNCEQAIDLLMVAKYFERIGDHAVNIAQWVVFAITGEHI